MDGPEAEVGIDALRRLKSTNAPLFLSPSEELAQAARVASQYLFSALKPFSSNCPFSQLITDGFDAEQIWPQIEGQSEPLVKNLRSQLRKFEKNPEEIKKQFNVAILDKKDEETSLERENGLLVRENCLLVRESKDFESEDEEGEDNEEGEGEEEEEEEDADDDGDEDDGSEGEGEKDEDDVKVNGVEDEFLKIKELEKYLVEDEAREYGLNGKEEKKRKRGGDDESSDENQEEDEDDAEDEDEDEVGLMGLDDGEDDEEDGLENGRYYKDFFDVKKKRSQKNASRLLDESDGPDINGRPINDDSDLKKQNLSTYEKEQQKLRLQIEQMEKANLEPKDWTMQGEVTAAKRAKNSALEVDLDFEHNVRPAPVITEEVTESLEELIKKRIAEGHFDDVRKPPTLLSRAPKEMKELDENKSKKGLAEVYEEEYVQKTGLVAAALSFSDEQKKEASMLFKKLCLKLDALSHFHFTPKPVIEDMSIEANVPALAMEEIAPIAVSDTAMLAPEEIFTGKGDIKEETELTQAERKRRRAKKKRKLKAESVKRMGKKAQQSMLSNHAEGNADS